MRTHNARAWREIRRPNKPPKLAAARGGIGTTPLGGRKSPFALLVLAWFDVPDANNDKSMDGAQTRRVHTVSENSRVAVSVGRAENSKRKHAYETAFIDRMPSIRSKCNFSTFRLVCPLMPSSQNVDKHATQIFAIIARVPHTHGTHTHTQNMAN